MRKYEPMQDLFDHEVPRPMEGDGKTKKKRRFGKIKLPHYPVMS